jgi:hypothetical protein
MIYRIPTFLAHATPLYNTNISLSKIIHTENLSSISCPHEESYFCGDLNLPNTFPWKKKMRISVSKNIAIRLYLKYTAPSLSPNTFEIPHPY